MTKVYEPLKWDGGERHYSTRELFLDKAYAKEVAGQHGIVNTYTLFQDISIHKEIKSGELKRKALSKLTADEIFALGIDLEKYWYRLGEIR